MSFKHQAFAFVAIATLAAPVPAWAFGGGGSPGCSNLPDYARAAGTLEGLSSCDMSVEQARRIIAAQSGGQVYEQPDAPVRVRHHRVRQYQDQQ